MGARVCREGVLIMLCGAVIFLSLEERRLWLLACSHSASHLAAMI